MRAGSHASVSAQHRDKQAFEEVPCVLSPLGHSAWIISSPKNLHLACRDPLALVLGPTKHVGPSSSRSCQGKPTAGLP